MVPSINCQLARAHALPVFWRSWGLTALAPLTPADLVFHKARMVTFCSLLFLHHLAPFHLFWLAWLATLGRKIKTTPDLQVLTVIWSFLHGVFFNRLHHRSRTSEKTWFAN